MVDKITSFRGEYFFLSNFYTAPVTYNGVTFKNNEAAFQAQKANDPIEVNAQSGMKIDWANLSPSDAKKAGRRVKLRKDWEDVKFGIMRDIVYAKFDQNPELRKKLLATGDAYLEEGNSWGDRTWGTVNGVGENYLGVILMDVRKAMLTKDFTDSVEAMEKGGAICQNK